MVEKKKTYQQPELKRLGTVAEVTQTNEEIAVTDVIIGSSAGSNDAITGGS